MTINIPTHFVQQFSTNVQQFSANVQLLLEQMLPKAKRFMFKRGYISSADFHELHDRLRARRAEIIEPALKHLKEPSVATRILLGDEHPVEARTVAIANFKKESWDRFAMAVREEAEAQWDRIVDRRASAWFYVLVSILFGLLL